MLKLQDLLTVNFMGNNQIITACGIQKISTHVTMNELSINNGLKTKLIETLTLNTKHKTEHKKTYLSAIFHGICDALTT